MKNHGKLAKLVGRAQKGDADAWSKLYELTYREAYLVAVKVTGSREDAQDLVHDGFVAVMNKLETINEPEKFQTWFNEIVANKCRDYLRKKKPDLFLDIAPEEEVFDWVDDRDDWQPEQKLDHEETIKLVAGIIEELPEDQKLCVILYYREEFSIAQIAQALEVSQGTVKSRLTYARKKVKAAVDALGKQGVVLYSFAPGAILMGILKAELLRVQIPASAAPAVTIGTAGTATGAAASGAAAGIGAKVIAGLVALSVAVGGVAVYQAVASDEPMPTVPPVIIETAPPASTSATFPSETTLPEKRDILAETLDFSKTWVIYYNFDGYTYLQHFVFEEGQQVYMATGILNSEFDGGEVGTYTISGNELSLPVTRYDGCVTVTYFYNPDTLQLTQLSEEGMFWGQTVGSVLQLKEAKDIDREKVKYMAEIFYNRKMEDLEWNS